MRLTLFNLFIRVSFAETIAKIFVGYDVNLLELSVFALTIYASSFVFAAFNIFASAFFTALNNGKISAFISFFRTLILQTIMIFVLPLLFGDIGLWLAVPIAEFIGALISAALLIKYRKKYNY